MPLKYIEVGNYSSELLFRLTFEGTIFRFSEITLKVKFQVNLRSVDYKQQQRLTHCTLFENFRFGWDCSR